MRDDSSLGAASSNQAPTAVPSGTEKRTLTETVNEDEAPDKAQNILIICVGQGASDKRGEVNAKEYDDDLSKMAEEYKNRNAAGECFVHIREP